MTIHFLSCFGTGNKKLVSMLFCIQIITLLHVLSLCLYYCCFVYRSSLYSMFYLYVCTIVVLYTDRHFTPCFIFMFVLLLFCVQIVTLLHVLSLCLYCCCFVYRSSLYSMFYLYVCTIVVLYTDRHFTPCFIFMFVLLLFCIQIITLLHVLSLCLYYCYFVYRSSLYFMLYLCVCTIVVLYTDRHFTPCFIFMFVLLLFCIQIVTLLHVLSLCLYYCCFVYRSSLYSMFYLYVCTIVVLYTDRHFTPCFIFMFVLLLFCIQIITLLHVLSLCLYYCCFVYRSSLYSMFYLYVCTIVVLYTDRHFTPCFIFMFVLFLFCIQIVTVLHVLSYVCTIVVLYTDRHFTPCFIFMFVLLLFCIQIVTLLQVLSLCLYYCCFVYRSSLYSMFYLYVCTIVVLYTDRHFTPCFIFMFVLLLFCIQIVTLLHVLSLCLYYCCFVYRSSLYSMFYLYVCTIVVLYTDRHFTPCFIFMFVLLLFCIQIVTLLHALSLCLYYCCFVYRSSLYSMFYLYVCTIIVLYTDRHFTPCFIFMFVLLLFCIQIVTLLHVLSLCLYYCCFVYRSSLYSMFYLYVCTIVVLYTDHHFTPCFIFMFVLLLFCIQIITLLHVLSLCLYYCCFVYRSSLYSMFYLYVCTIIVLYTDRHFTPCFIFMFVLLLFCIQIVTLLHVLSLCLYYCFVYRSSLYSMFYLYVCTIVVLYTDHHFTPCFIFMFVLFLFCIQIVTLLHVLSLCLYYCCFVYRSSLYFMLYLSVCTIVVLCTDHHFTPCFIFIFVLLLFCIQIITLLHALSLCLYYCCFVYRSSLYSMFYLYVCTIVVLYTDHHFTPCFIFMFVLLLLCIQIITLLHVLSLCLYYCCFVYRSSLYSMFYLYVCTIVALCTDHHFTPCFILCLYYCCFVYRSSLYSMFYLYVCTIVVLYTDRHFTPCFILCLYYCCFVYRSSLYSMFYLYVCTIVVLCTDHHFTPCFIFMFVLLLFCIQIVTLLHVLSLCLYYYCFVYRSSLYSMFYLYVCTIVVLYTDHHFTPCFIFMFVLLLFCVQIITLLHVLSLCLYYYCFVYRSSLYSMFYLYVCTVIVLYTDRHFTPCFIFMFVLLLFCIQIVTLLLALSLCLYYFCFVYRSSLYSMFYLYVCTIFVLYTDRHFTPCFIFMFVLLLFCIQIITLLHVLSLCLYYFCFVYRSSLYSMFYLCVCTIVVLYTDRHFTSCFIFLFVLLLFCVQIITLLHVLSLYLYCCCFVYRSSLYFMLYLYVCTIVVLYTDHHFTPCFIFMFVLLLFCIQIITLLHVLSLCLYYCCFVYRSSLYSMFYLYVCTIVVLCTDHHFTPCFIFMFVLLLFCIQIITLLHVLSLCLYYCCFVYRSSLYSMFYLYVCTVVLLCTDRPFTPCFIFMFVLLLFCIQIITLLHDLSYVCTIVVLYTDHHFTSCFIFMFVLLLFCVQIVTLLHDLSYVCTIVVLYTDRHFTSCFIFVCTIVVLYTDRHFTP